MPRVVALVSLLGLVGHGCAPAPSTSPRARPSVSHEPALVEAAVAADETIDPSVDPCDDFYRHACGGWIARTKVDASRPVVVMAQEQFETVLEHELNVLLSGNEPTSNPDITRVRTFFASCMASGDGADADDAATLQSWLRKIDDIDDRAAVQAVLRELHGIGVPTFFSYSGRASAEDLTRHRGELHPSILWTKNPAKIEQAFAIAGVEQAQAARDAQAVARIDASLMQHARSRWAPQANNPHTRRALGKLAPHVDWMRYFELVGAPPDAVVNVTSPDFVRALDELLAQGEADDLRAYLRWSLLFSLRGELPRAYAPVFVDAPPMYRVAWGEPAKRCQEATVRALGVELSRAFAHEILGPEARAEATRVAQEIRVAFVRAVETNPWLSPSGREATADKLAKTDLKIGYPDVWPATGDFALSRDRFLDNVLTARAFEARREWQRASKPRSRQSWEMFVHPWVGEGMAAARLSVPNGFPDAFSNSIIMTAAYLMPPRFGASSGSAANFATFGRTVAHELVHVAETHMFGAQGQPAVLWGPSDIAAAEQASACVVDQANAFVPFEGGVMDGARQIHENVADYAGVRLAYEVLAAREGAALSEPGDDGKSGAQRFFYAYAHAYCTAETLESQRQSLAHDRHAPAAFRVNGPLSNLPAFAEAFGCTPDDAMVRAPDEQCVVW